jgi:hypothetical protein
MGAGPVAQDSSTPPGAIELGPISLKENQVQVWKISCPPQSNDMVPTLEFDARAWREGLAPRTSAYIMDIRINDEPVKAAYNRLRFKLRNKPLMIPRVGSWHSLRVGWRSVIAPDFDDSYAGPFGSGAFHFVIEIGDLLKPGDNTLSFRNIVNQGQILMLRNLRLTMVPAQRHDEGLVVPGKNPPLLDVTPTGAIMIQSGKHQFPVSSAFSIPGGGWLCLGTGVPSRRGEQPVQPKVRSTGEEKKISFSAEAYHVERSVRFVNGRAWVLDRITNETKDDLGLMIRHEMLLPTQKAAVVHLAGDEDPSWSQRSEPSNPTVFIPMGGLSVGLVAEDDVFRLQAILSYSDSPARAGIRTERLAIPAGETITLQWSAYALSGTDYYDFINRVRRDWLVRLKLDGPYWWNALTRIDQNDDSLREWLHKSRVFAAVIGSWVDKEKKEKQPTVALGAGVLDPMFANYREQLHNAVAKIHRLAPGVKVLIYNQLWFNWPEPDPTRFQDAWITLRDGRRYVELWNGRYSRAPGAFPTSSNSFGLTIRQTLVEERAALGADGVYLDETTGPGRLNDPITYNAWDRRSAILDPKTFAIQKKIGYLVLLSEDFYHTIVADLRKDGAGLLGNHQPQTYSFTRESWPRFTETDNLRNSFQAQLYSPLAYSYRFENYTVQDLRDRLDVGLIYCVTGPGDKLGIVSKFFPITPVELHSGYVRGEERIITDRSGRFGWSDPKHEARLWRFRQDGTPVEVDPPWQILNGLVRVDVPAKGIAILERNPDKAGK